MKSDNDVNAGLPGILGSQLDLGNIGDIGKSVNLFRGDVNLPLKLVSLAGRNNLDVNVAALYGSNIHTLVNTWNMDAPTDVLGVGWAMSFEKIVVDIKNTGTGYDDNFYIVMGGNTIPLFRMGMEGDVICFQAKNYNFWKIYYYQDQENSVNERWEIVKEDGSRYIYGASLQEGNYIYGENGTQQWGVKWKNWVGSTANTGGTQYPVAWNLAQIINNWNDCIYFEYENDNIPISGNDVTQYTRASRMSKITDVYGQTVNFVYAPKEEKFEIQLPIIPPRDINAFQFKYEEHFLDKIVVKNENKGLLFTILFQYDFYNVSNHPEDDYYKKRYLKSVRTINGNGESYPGVSFDYHTDYSTDVNPGALKTVTFPNGGIATYKYESGKLTNTSTRREIKSPGADFAPSVWHGSDYVVVTWYSSGRKQVLVSVYSWGGNWREWKYDKLNNLNIQDFKVVNAQGFFAVYFKDLNLGQYRLFLFRQNEYRFGEWAVTEVALGKEYTSLTIATGEDFVAIYSPNATRIRIQQWDALRKKWGDTGVVSKPFQHVAIVANNNFFIVGGYDEQAQRLFVQLYYADANRKWRIGGATTVEGKIDVSYTNFDNLWALGSSFAVAAYITNVDQANLYYTLLTINWKSDFSFADVSKHAYSQDRSLGNAINTMIINNELIGSGQRVARFNGERWVDTETVVPVAPNEYQYVYGDDIAITTKKIGNTLEVSSVVYDPYQSRWTEGNIKGVISGNQMSAPSIAGNYCTAVNNVYFRDQRRTWNKILTLPPNIEPSSIQNRAPGYLLYQMKNEPTSTYLLFFKDGNVISKTKLEGENIHVSGNVGEALVGASAFVAYRGLNFAETQSLTVYRVVNESIDDEGQVDYSVRSISVCNGYNQIDTNYKYNRETATYDPVGLVSQFSQASIWYPEEGGEFSYSDNIYFNGLDPEMPDVQYPATDEFTNVREYYSCFSGQLYQSNSYHANGRKVAGSVNYLYAFDQTEDEEPLYGGYTRTKKKVDTTQLYLFDLEPSLEADLTKGIFSAPVRENFQNKGFSFSQAVSILIPYVDKKMWIIRDKECGQEYTVCQEDNKLAVYGQIVKTNEYVYNGKGQLAKTSTYNFNSSGHEEKVSVGKQYGWQVYPELLAMNLLTLEVQSKIWNETQNIITGITVLTLKNWDKDKTENKWGADTTYKWDGTTGTEKFDYQGWPNSGEPIRGWIKTGEIVAINKYGIAAEAMDIDNIHSSTLFAFNNRFAVATFKNASITQGEISYYGFEEYENPQGWVLFPHTEPLKEYINEGDSYTGTRRLSLPGQSLCKVGLTNTLTINGDDKKYVLSCWMKTAKNITGDGNFVGWEITVAGESTKTIYVPALLTNETWKYFYYVIDPATIGISDARQVTLSIYNLQDNHELLVDNIGFAPFAANFEAAIYETPYQLNTAVIRMGGETSRTTYDAWQRSIVIAGNNNNPQVLSVGAGWKEYRDNFDPTDPNHAAKIIVRTGGFLEEFRHGNQWEDNWQTSVGWDLTGRKLVYSGATVGSITLKNSVNQKNYGVRVNMSLGEKINQGIGIKIGDCIIQWDKGQWKLYNGRDGKVLDSMDQPEMNAKDWLVIAGEHGVLFFADGRQVLKGIFPTMVVGQFQLFTANKIALEALTVFNDPITSMEYTDNCGKTLQVQKVDDCSVFVQAFCGDQLGRAAITTKIGEFDHTLFEYRPEFVRSIDWNSGVMLGEIADCYPDDEGYPYSRIRYEKSTLARIVEQGGTGKLFAINLEVPVENRHTVVTRYCANTKNPLLPDLPAGEYSMTIEIDRDKNVSTLLSDKVNNKIAAIEGCWEEAYTNLSMSRNDYDVYGNLVETKLPNYFQKNIPQYEKFQIKKEYDFWGRVIRETTPDITKAIVHIFDKTGRIRFMQDANGAQEGYFIYWLYDSLGRNTEKGISKCQWDEVTLQGKVEEETWRPEPAVWDKKYMYDGSGSDPNLVGRLWKVLSSSEGNLQVQTEETFTYDLDGQIIRKIIKVFDYDSGKEHISSYTYDNMGNNISITYNEEDAAPFIVDYRFNNQGQLWEINGKDGPVAHYAYNADSSIKTEVFNPGQQSELIRAYNYNTAGWLLTLQDKFFTEKLDYTGDEFAGEGQYSGKILRATYQFNGIENPGEFVTNYSYQYVYDKMGMLQTASNDKNNEWSMGNNTPLTYDANCNVCHWSKGHVEKDYMYDPGTNKVLGTSNNEENAYHYNSNGDITLSEPRGITSITYSKGAGVALKIEGSGGDLAEEVTFGYDGGDRRVFKKNHNSCRLYILSTNGNPLVEKEKEVTGEETVIFNIYGPTGIVAVQRAGKIYNLLKDHLSSTRAIYDGTGICAAYNYTPFGEFMGGIMELPGCKPITRYLYTGQEFDDETGLYNYKSRFYDPCLGRFYSTDPAGQFPGPYAYAGNDPIAFYDPSGQTSLWSILSIIGGIAVLAAGIALAVVSGGTSLAAAGAIGGGLLAGAGAGSAMYGATHTENFRAAEWGAMVGLGAAFGAISGGVSMIAGGALMAGATGIATNTVLGGVESFVSNGVMNVMNGQGFCANAGLAVGIGVGIGFAITGIGTVAVRSMQRGRAGLHPGNPRLRSVLDGHGGWDPENGKIRVGNNQNVLFYGEQGKTITVSEGVEIAQGGRLPTEIIGPNQSIPNYTLYPPEGYAPYPGATTVGRATTLKEIMADPNMGDGFEWSACRVVNRSRWTLYGALTNAGGQVCPELK